MATRDEATVAWARSSEAGLRGREAWARRLPVGVVRRRVCDEGERRVVRKVVRRLVRRRGGVCGWAIVGG